MISTKNLAKETGGSTPKTITPGQWTVQIHSAELTVPPYDTSSYFLSYNVEGPDLGPSFEGFLVDPSKPSGPRYKGQIGRVKSNFYSYKDSTLPNGQQVQRDNQILRAVYNACVAVNKASWIEEVDGKYATIEEFVKGFSKMISGSWVKMTIGGKEYNNKQGYTNYDLFLVKSEKNLYSMEAADAQPSKLIPFDAEKHIKKLKVEKVESFGEENPFTSSESGESTFEFQL